MALDLPLVSILVNCYNSEPYLKEALDSIYAQTYQNFQIILVDNCSTDHTPQIAKSYDARLIYVKTDKLIPLYGARNVGLKYFHGDYLAFLDSDDVWLPSKLEKQLAAIRLTSATFIYGNYGNIVEHSSPLKKLIIKFYLGLLKVNLNFRKSDFIKIDRLIKNYDINLQTVLIDKNIIKDSKFNEHLNLYGDFEYFVRLILNEKIQAYYLSEKISLSRVHQKQLSRRNSESWVKEFKICFKILAPSMNRAQKKEFLQSHYSLHKSNILIEKGILNKALEIKFHLAGRSIPLFLHFTKTCLDVLLKKIF